MGSRDESDAFAPRVTFVRAPRRWEQNAGRGSAGAAFGGGEAVGASDAGAAAAVPDDARRPSVDGRKMMEELEAWMRRTNLRRAPEAHYLDVETLRDLFVADRAAHAGEPADAERDVELKVFGSLFGIACSKAFGAPRLARRRGAIGVTCDARAAAPPASPGMSRRDAEALGVNGNPVDDELRRAGRREASAKARAKKALLDPARSRDVSKFEPEGRSHSRYVTELLKLACGPELVRLRLFPDAKELTETFAANNAARSFLYPRDGNGGGRVDPADKTVTCVAIGDGNTPRTAALFAFLTRWHCVAVDPEMVEWREWKKRRGVDDVVDDDVSSARGETGDETADDALTGAWGGVRRLRAFRKKIQEVSVECENAILVLVHAHVSLAECLAQVKTRSGRCSAVILPCCNWYQKLRHPEGAAPLAEYDDGNVASPQRTVRVFDDLPCGTLGGLPGTSEASDAVCETVPA